MEKRFPLSYYLETFLGLSSTHGNLNRWKALLRKSYVPIIMDSGNWLIKEKDFETFLKGREHCFRYENAKVVRITKSKERYSYQTEASESDSLQKLLISKRQKLKPMPSTKVR